MDVSMSPVCTPQNAKVGWTSTGLSPMPSPGGFGGFSPAISPCVSTQLGQTAFRGGSTMKGAPANASTIPARFVSASQPAAGMQVLSPGTEIRQNAATFGIPLSMQRAAGELVLPVPVRTTSGHVVEPSPMSRSAAVVAADAALHAMRAVATPATYNTANISGGLPAAGNRPFVTPFSAGLRGGA